MPSSDLHQRLRQGTSCVSNPQDPDPHASADVALATQDYRAKVATSPPASGSLCLGQVRSGQVRSGQVRSGHPFRKIRTPKDQGEKMAVANLQKPSKTCSLIS